VHNAARWIPDRDYSNRKLFIVSFITLVTVIGIPLYYSYAFGPPSYSWDIEFTNAPIDDFTGMYVVEKNVNINSRDSVYNLTIWADTTPGNNILIQVIRPGPPSSWDTLEQTWTIDEHGVIQSPPDVYGTKIDGKWSWFGSTIWKISSSSRDQVVHIRIKYLKYENDDWLFYPK
jgi:hypothetical protein